MEENDEECLLQPLKPKSLCFSGSQALFVALNQLCLFISANFSVLKALGLLSFQRLAEREIWLKSHCKRQRWAGKSYKNSHLGNEWKKLFAGSSHAKGIVLEKIGIEAKQPNFAIDKCARVQLIKNWKKIAAFFPNDGFLNYIEANVSACLCLLVSLLSYPNFVRGPLLGGMQLVFGHFEVLGTHH
ncbi:40S ribosomal protein S23 [Glycine soja]|uniref:40S ribosomal protein S23 n=1 Tax=Glycine soja TaxID=3848 RepID=A0A445KED4_GLYSO|nr:40S ribosomal protein S23 [Glycine soja]